MKQRTTKKDVERQFMRLCCLFGKRKATSYKDVGAWRLDHIPIYGGYTIEEIATDSGAVRHPFGHERRKATAFVAWAFDITEAIAVYTGAYENNLPLYKTPLSTLEGK